MKAENAPNERQSRPVLGLLKLHAKIKKTREFRMTSGHRPQAESFIARSRPIVMDYRIRGRRRGA
jgi:hypothetical protein